MAHPTRTRALGLTALALLWVAATRFEIGPIELDVTARAAAALGAAGLDDPALLAAGRDVAISGAASSARARQGAVEAVAGVWGVRKIDARLVWIRRAASAEPGAPAPRAAPAAGFDWLSYDIFFLWPWLTPAAILGAAEARGRRGRGLALRLGAAATAFAAGIAVAATGWPPGRPGFWLEAGSLFLAAFFVGGAAAHPFSRSREKVDRRAG